MLNLGKRHYIIGGQSIRRLNVLNTPFTDLLMELFKSFSLEVEAFSNLRGEGLEPSKWSLLESRCPLVMVPTTYPYFLGFLRVQVALEGQETLMGKVSNENMKGHLSEV